MTQAHRLFKTYFAFRILQCRSSLSRFSLAALSRGGYHNYRPPADSLSVMLMFSVAIQSCVLISAFIFGTSIASEVLQVQIAPLGDPPAPVCHELAFKRKSNQTGQPSFKRFSLLLRSALLLYVWHPETTTVVQGPHLLQVFN